MEIFSCKTKIISGHGSVWELGQLDITRLLLVADPFFRKTDLPEKLKKASNAQVMESFFEVKPDPTIELAAQGTALVQRFKPDTVVALGGGSAMDCAKAMVYFSGLPIRLVAIPSTSGSGSEVTDFAVLTHGGTKHPLVDSALLPQVAILDGNLLDSLPKSLIADAGFDIIAHATESYVAPMPLPPHTNICLPLMGAIPRCASAFTWRPPWQARHFPSRDWAFAMPLPMHWVDGFICPTAD